ncbi:twitching motility protein PilT [Achromatium sp. WMS3]|nr:twitching motility protein PilT [Achromatium sp. WMS3]
MVILDTHIWLWWINQHKLKSTWLEHIEQANQVGISAISLFEVACLDQHNRIQLPIPRNKWFEKALTGSGIQLVPITPEIASKAVDLPEHHSDPQDRIIIATALIHNTLLLSADDKFKFYTELKDKLIQ